MARIGDILNWQTQVGLPLQVGETTVTPVAQAFRVRWPRGGFVWNRPVAVVIEQDGQAEYLPIPDITRTLHWALLAAAVGLSVVMFILSTRSEERSKEKST